MMLRITPVTLYQLFIVLMIAALLLPIKHTIPFPYNLSGVIAFLIGSFIALGAKRMFKQTNTPMDHFAKPVKLHTHGIFRFTRNPMYLGISIALAGVAIITGIIFNLAFSIFYMILMDVFFVRHEEEKLKNEFGELYQHYKRRTRRWL